MQGIQINEAKAPWVMFERRAEEDRAASIAEGRYVAKDIDYALITPHGSKDQIERVVKDWFEHLEQQVREERFDAVWLSKYKAAYENWKAGKEIPIEGTPILNWPLLSPAQVRMLQDLHILTIEALAGSNEEAIRRMGMGGRNLVNKAQEFLKQVKEGRSTEEVIALREIVEGLKAVVEAQKEQIAALIAQQNVGKPDAFEQQQIEGRGGAGVGLDDLIDKTPPPALKKL